MLDDLEKRLDGVLIRLRDHCLNATFSDIASIWVYNEKEKALNLRKVLSSDGLEFSMPLESRAIVTHIYNKGQFVISNDLQEEPRDDQGLLHNSKVSPAKLNQLMGVPMITKDGKRIGVIQAMKKTHTEHPGEYNEQNAAVLQSIANFAADCIVGATERGEILPPTKILEEMVRYSQEITRAASFRQEMQRQIPKTTKYDIATLNLPSAEMGGDWYLIKSAEKDIGILLGDLESHGIAVSQQATSCLAVADTLLDLPQFAGREQRLALIRQLNKKATERGMKYTLSYTVFEETGKLHCFQAGHENPVIFFPSGEILEVKAEGGLPLGYYDDEEYIAATNKAAREYTLLPNQFYFVWTDGATDLNNPEMERYSKERLLKFVSKRVQEKNQSPKEVLDALKKDFRDFAKFNFLKRDDISAMLVKRI